MAMEHPDPIRVLELEWVDRTLTLTITTSTDDLAEAMFDRLRQRLIRTGHLRIGPFVVGGFAIFEEEPS